MADEEKDQAQEQDRPRYELVYVKSGLPDAYDGGGRVALHDFDDAHPNGEVFVAGQASLPQQVAKTPLVAEYLKDGRLVEVSKGDFERAKKDRDAEMAKREARRFLSDYPHFAAVLEQHGVPLPHVPMGPKANPQFEEFFATEGQHGSAAADEHAAAAVDAKADKAK